MPEEQKSEGGDLLARFDQGEDSAAKEIVDAYYERLVGLARKRLGNLPPQVADEEGAVISALRSFFSAVQGGQIRQVDDEHDLWRLLAMITARKAIRQMRVYWKQSGEANRVTRDAELRSLVSTSPNPADEAMLLEECQTRLQALDDPTLEKIALMKLEGCNNQEIVDRLSIHIRSVQRKLKLIEAKWLDAEPD